METIRYDTIRDAILTCARKPTWVSLIYRTDRQLKSVKTEKTKSRKQICSEITVNSLGTDGHDQLQQLAAKVIKSLERWLIFFVIKRHYSRVFYLVEYLVLSETAVARNADRAALTTEHQTRQCMLGRELQQLNRSRRTEVGNSIYLHYNPLISSFAFLIDISFCWSFCYSFLTLVSCWDTASSFLALPFCFCFFAFTLNPLLSFCFLISSLYI